MACSRTRERSETTGDYFHNACKLARREWQASSVQSPCPAKLQIACRSCSPDVSQRKTRTFEGRVLRHGAYGSSSSRVIKLTLWCSAGLLAGAKSYGYRLLQAHASSFTAESGELRWCPPFNSRRTAGLGSGIPDPVAGTKAKSRGAGKTTLD